MASASGRLVALTTLTALLLGGCSATFPVSKQEAPENSVESALARAPQTSAPIPRQPYADDGTKQPYQAQTNPYEAQGDAPPAAAKMLYVAGTSAMRAKQWKQARLQFEKLTRQFPKLSGGWYKLGEIAASEGEQERAIEQFRKALTVNKNNVNAYIALALLQRQSGKFVEAQHTYHQALAVWPDFPEAQLNLAILLDLYLNQPEEAQRHYEAYDFLTNGKDPKVAKWLTEVRRRTGIEHSFIDTPPRAVAEVPKPKPDEALPPASAAAGSG